jgi:trans-aconitate 2-methyltransferase
VFANASLHWVPDHPAVLARWWAALAPGGQLAVQVPSNADHASHTVAVELAEREPYLSALGGTPPPDPVAANVLTPERYAGVLHDLGAARQHVRLQVYGHVLDRSADVVEWVKGTSLTRFAKALPPDLYDRFVDEYRRLLLAEIGDTAPYFYPFKRVLMWATRNGG